MMKNEVNMSLILDPNARYQRDVELKRVLEEATSVEDVKEVIISLFTALTQREEQLRRVKKEAAFLMQEVDKYGEMSL